MPNLQIIVGIMKKKYCKPKIEKLFIPDAWGQFVPLGGCKVGNGDLLKCQVGYGAVGIKCQNGDTIAGPNCSSGVAIG